MTGKKQKKPKTIKIHVIEMLNLLVHIKRTRLQVGHAEYNSVIDSELIAAIKRCENEEQAVFEMSYPLSDPGMLHGVMGLKAYMLNLFFENIFCSGFSPEELAKLVGICESSRNGTQSYNIYNKVFLNALFCEYLQKDIGILNLRQSDCASAQKLLSVFDEQRQYEILAETANRISSAEVHNYNAKAFEKLSPKIMTALKKKKLAGILVIE